MPGGASARRFVALHVDVLASLSHALLAALQKPLCARLCWLHPALHSWRVCACTAAQRACIRAKFNGNMHMVIMRGRTLASGRLLVTCAGTHAAKLAV